VVHNWPVTDETEHGRRPLDPPGLRPGVATAVPIPELMVVEHLADLTSAFADGEASDRAVGDDERTRYGLLLDRAAERGLLTPAEYQIRLRAVAEATSVDEMRTIVTELPVLEGPVVRSSKRARSNGRSLPPATALPPGAAQPPAATPPAPGALGGRSSPWFVLVVVVVVLVLSMVFFAVYAEHLIHTHNSVAGAGQRVLRTVSALRS
jgi:hypothetical protein